MGRWLGVLLIALPMVCATAPVFAQDQAAKAEWKEYPYPDDGFALTAPSQPTLQKQQQATAAGNVEMRQYSVDLGNNAGVLMSVSDFPNTADSDPEKILESAVNCSIQATKAKKTSEKDISLQQIAGIEFEADGDTFHMRGRYYWLKGRLFSFLTIAPLGTPIPDAAVRVFDSLKFLDLPVPVWKEYSYADDGFAMTAPSQPTFEKQQQPTASGNIEMRQYSVKLDGVDILMSVSDFPNANHATPKAALEGAVKASLPPPEATMISEKDVELQQVPGIEFVGKNGDYRLLGRYYWKNNRMFSFLAVAPWNTPMPADGLRVLDSLKFVAK